MVRKLKLRMEIRRGRKAKRGPRPTVYSEICPNLFQSGQPNCVLPPGVRAVMSVENAPPATPFVGGLSGFAWLPFDDTPSARPTVEWLDNAVNMLIGWHAKNLGCLVHCKAGKSRSTLIVAAYLIKTNRMKAAVALDWIRARRPQIAPNIGFIQALEEYAAHVADS